MLSPKRGFRPHRRPDPSHGAYPTGPAYEPTRRAFLARLGAVVAGGAAVLSGCVTNDSEKDYDSGPGKATDGGTDREVPVPDYMPEGAMPAPDARLDLYQLPPDLPRVVDGLPPRPDAALDLYAPPPDVAYVAEGLPPMPDAAKDLP